MYKVLLVNGPYLNFDCDLSMEIYGNTSVKEIEKSVSSILSANDISYESFQSNSEDEIVNWLKKKSEADFLLLNPGALTNSCLGLRNTVLEIKIPFLEIHLNYDYSCKESKFFSNFSDLSLGVLAGLGLKGFSIASKFAIDYLDQHDKSE
tara:strand:+ start:5924 stop:6373 length:450 start_codon:yes stop_codon:yes gene_type:complete